MNTEPKMQKTKDRGVYVRESAVRRHNGKADTCYYITYKDDNGKKVWEKIGWHSDGYRQTSAAATRRKRMQEKDSGVVMTHDTRKITFGAAYDKWVEVHLPTLKNDKMVKTLAKCHVLPRFEGRAMHSITRLDIATMQTEMEQAGLSVQTIRHATNLVSRVFRKAMEWGIYSGGNPVALAAAPKPDNARLRYLTKKEAKSLLEKLEEISPLWHDIALISLHTGLRLSDILQLRGRQINFADGYIDVLESKPGTYTAYYSPDVARVLQGRMTTKDALLFPSSKGAPKIYGLGKPFVRAVKLCELNNGVTDDRYKVVFHTLRHTFASWLVQGGVSLNTVGELMGHKDLKMTQRYAKLSPESKSRAVEAINTLLHDD